MEAKPPKGRVVIPLMIFLLCMVDVGVTYYMLTLFPKGWNEEISPVSCWLFKKFGMKTILLVASPIGFAVLSSILYSMWSFKFVRVGSYIVLIERMLVVCWNLYLAHEAIQRLIACSR